VTTDDLLSKLRCTECRLIRFDHFFDASIKAALVTLSGVFVWVLVLRVD
jgi:hypothetical protein